MERQNKSVTVNIRLDEATKKQLQKLADNDRRTLSDFVRVQLENLAKSFKK